MRGPLPSPRVTRPCAAAVLEKKNDGKRPRAMHAATPRLPGSCKCWPPPRHRHTPLPPGDPPDMHQRHWRPRTHPDAGARHPWGPPMAQRRPPHFRPGWPMTRPTRTQCKCPQVDPSTVGSGGKRYRRGGGRKQAGGAKEEGRGRRRRKRATCSTQREWEQGEDATGETCQPHVRLTTSPPWAWPLAGQSRTPEGGLTRGAMTRAGHCVAHQNSCSRRHMQNAGAVCGREQERKQVASTVNCPRVSPKRT